VTYTLTILPTAAETTLYTAGTQGDLQVEMGLYGQSSSCLCDSQRCTSGIIHSNTWRRKPHWSETKLPSWRRRLTTHPEPAMTGNTSSSSGDHPRIHRRRKKQSTRAALLVA